MLFFCSEDTGELVLVETLDRETTGSYTFNVQAIDGINTDTASVTINVGDINDNEPIFNPTKYRLVLICAKYIIPITSNHTLAQVTHNNTGARYLLKKTHE